MATMPYLPNYKYQIRDGELYRVFDNEYDATRWIENRPKHRRKYYYLACFNGYMNAVYTPSFEKAVNNGRSRS